MIETKIASPVQEVARKDKELLNVQEFQEILSSVEGVQTIRTPIHMEVEEPTDDSVRYFLNSERAASPHMYVHQQYETLTANDITGFVPYVTRGKRSAHGVFFGEIMTEEGNVSIAVKPHEIDGDRSCANDYFTNEAAKQLGFESLESFGMIMGPGDKAYSMTILNPEITTLDSIDWKTVLRKEGTTGETMQVWGQVARQAAMLHSVGRASHRDLAARNIAQHVDGGVFFIDWETAKLSKVPPRDAEGRYEHSRADMGELLESMARPRKHDFKAGIGLLEQFPNDWAAFRELVFDEYVQTRLDFAAKKELRDVQDELVELEQSLKGYLKLVISQ